MGDNMSPADLKAVLDNNNPAYPYPMYNNGFGNGFGADGGWIWLILILALFGGFGGNNWGDYREDYRTDYREDYRDYRGSYRDYRDDYNNRDRYGRNRRSYRDRYGRNYRSQEDFNMMLEDLAEDGMELARNYEDASEMTSNGNEKQKLMKMAEREKEHYKTVKEMIERKM